MIWHDIRQWGVEGKGWEDTERYYDRLPLRARETVPAVVWDLSHSATGMAARFETDAPEVWGRWQMESETFHIPNFPAAGFSGLDLYAWTRKSWRWAGAGDGVHGSRHEQALVTGMMPKRRKFLLYLPLKNPVVSVEIGVPEGSTITPIPPRKRRSLVFYGTSIMQGFFASRAGTVHTALLGRWLNRPVINLGFSGNGRMEMALAGLMAEVSAKVYVLDCVPNMNAEMIRERVEPFVRLLRGCRPKTPIVLVGGRPFTNGWIRPMLLGKERAAAVAYRRAFEKLTVDGIQNIHLVEGDQLFGNDHEASPDGSHPTDLGFHRMAEVLYPILRQLV